MKPIKKVYCGQCGESRVLFETRSKAMNFIRYNAADIREESGFAPVRAYRCSCCAGWHVTSNYISQTADERTARQQHKQRHSARRDTLMKREWLTERTDLRECLQTVNTFFNLAMESFDNNNLALCCSQLRRARTLFAEAKTLHGARRIKLHIEEDIERLWTKVMLRGQQLHVRNANSLRLAFC